MDQTVLPQPPEQAWMPRAVSATSRPIAQFLGTKAALAGGTGTSSCRTHAAERSRGRTVWQGWRPSLYPACSCSQWTSRMSPGRHQLVVTDSHRLPAAADASQCPATATVSSLAGVPKADTSLSEGLAQAWLCVPVCDSSLVPPRHQPPGTPAQALSPAPTQGAWHASAAGLGSRLPPVLREQDGQQHTRCAGGCRRAPGARTSQVSSRARAVGSEVSRPRRAELFC